MGTHQAKAFELAKECFLCANLLLPEADLASQAACASTTPAGALRRVLNGERGRDRPCRDGQMCKHTSAVPILFLTFLSFVLKPAVFALKLCNSPGTPPCHEVGVCTHPIAGLTGLCCMGLRDPAAAGDYFRRAQALEPNGVKTTFLLFKVKQPLACTLLM